MSLYQNVRPDTLEGYYGNTKTVGALVKMAKRSPDKRPHVYLLHGPSGCGKTTLARILGKMYGIQKDDMHEKNAANTRGIDDVREWASLVKQKPMDPDSTAKGYIIDESHQLTAAAQEALLKTLEDYPKHAYFFMCTTDPDALIKTIRNRAKAGTFMITPLNQEETYGLLADACEKEKLTIPDSVLMSIIESCEGSGRLALGMLEQVLDLDEKTALSLIQKGSQHDVKVIDICKLMYAAAPVRKKKWQHIMDVLNDLLKNEDPEKIRRAITGFLAKHILESTEDEEEAQDIAWLLNIFSHSAYYGGKPLLVAQVARAIFDEPNWRNK